MMTAAAAARMMKNSQYGRPRIGTGWLRNGRFVLTTTACVYGWIRPDVGVMTRSYEPSAWPAGKVSLPMKKPATWEVVVFNATVPAPDRSAIVRSPTENVALLLPRM